MELLNERNQVRAVPAKWAKQYGKGTYGCDRRGRLVGKELAAMDVETATAETVAEIIGNGSWVKEQTCHECGAESWNVVQIGEPPDYESSTAIVCEGCLRAALQLLTHNT